MIVHIDIYQGKIFVNAIAEGKGGLIGDFEQIVEKGQSFQGISFEDLKKHGPGPLDTDNYKKRKKK